MPLPRRQFLSRLAVTAGGLGLVPCGASNASADAPDARAVDEDPWSAFRAQFNLSPD